MQGDDQTRAIEPGYLTQDVTKVPGWHGLVAWDLLFNNLTTGLFLFAAVGELAVAGVTRSRGQGGVSRRAGLLAHRPADAGARPGRSAPVPSHAPGVQAQLAHVPGHVEPHRLFAAADLDRGDRSGASARPAATGSIALEWVRKSAVVFGLLPAFGSVAYKGVLFSTSSQPGWKDARWLGGCMANSALMLGCAELLAVSVLTGHARAAAALRTVAAVLVCTQHDPDRSRLPGNSRDPLANLQRPADLPCLVLTFVGGTLVPVVLLLAGDGAPWHLGAVLLIVLGGFAVRSLFLKIPHASHESRSRDRA